MEMVPWIEDHTFPSQVVCVHGFAGFLGDAMKKPRSDNPDLILRVVVRTLSGSRLQTQY
jgi:hypothetical protein